MLLLRGRGFRWKALLQRLHTFEEVKVDTDGFLMQALVVDPRLADPVLGFLFQEHPE
jgi:hypothetical protein